LLGAIGSGAANIAGYQNIPLEVSSQASRIMSGNAGSLGIVTYPEDTIEGVTLTHYTRLLFAVSVDSLAGLAGTTETAPGNVFSKNRG
jgi:hypothetical protein